MATRPKVRRRSRQEEQTPALPVRAWNWARSPRGLWVMVSAVLALGLIITYFPQAFLGAAGGGGAVGSSQVRGPGELLPSMGNEHLTPGVPFSGTYNSDPPTSGPHWGVAPPFGVNEQPVPKEAQIHALEDGGVVINYDCDLYGGDCGQLKEELEAIARSRQRVVLAPYELEDAGTPIVLTAWQRMLKLEELDRDKILQFIRVYEGIDHHVR